MSEQRFNIPTILVVFGVTGDLMRRKMIPALFYLFEQGQLPKLFKVVGYGRRPWETPEFHDYLTEVMEKSRKENLDRTKLAEFLDLFTYQRGAFEGEDDYKGLAQALGRMDDQWSVCSNKLFYLSVPPDLYQTIFENLKASHLTDPCGQDDEGWTRVLVEKPFGSDLETATRLDAMLAELFKEEQIYRIDHYLAKEMLQNILNFRFSNNLFEGSWSNTTIERIEIRLLETLGVEDRGAFYDGVGALRDVGQNHLLQMLALVTMEQPANYTAEAIRTKRAELLEKIHALSTEEITNKTLRAQYEGYRGIEGVQENSNTETYFKVETSVDSPRWSGVPVTLEGGKRMGRALKEIVVFMKHPQPCLCPEESHLQNKIIFQLEPEESIKITVYAKKAGFENELEERSFDFIFDSGHAHLQYVEEYAKLMLDCIAGDQTLFVSTDEVKTMWQAIDSIVMAWQQNAIPLRSYKPDTETITEEQL